MAVSSLRGRPQGFIENSGLLPEQRERRKSAKAVLASLLPNQSIGMIEKISLNSQSVTPTFARELVSPSRRFAASERLSQVPVFAVTSGKGGVGKTNIVANLAAALILQKQRVLVIDADLGLANLDLFLGVKPIYTLADFFAGLAGLDEIIIPTPDGILLLPGARGVQEVTALRSDQKIALLTEIDALGHEVDLVLVDTGSGISDAVTYFATSAQEIVVVVTPDPSSMTDAYALVNVLASGHREKRFYVLVNSVSDETEARQIFDILSRAALRFLNASLDFFGWIPRDPQLTRAVARSQMVVIAASDAPATKAFARIAERLIQIGRSRSRIKGNVQFFFRRLLEKNRETR